MNKKEKTMTASRAAHELGVSRESVFMLIRQGKLMRAGYAVRNHHRVALVTVDSVLYEKTHRKASKTRRKAAGGKVHAPEKKTRGRGQRIENTGVFASGHAGTPAEEPREEYFWTELTPEETCKASCFAARDSAKVSMELSKTAAACSKWNAEACAGFKRLCAWFTILCGICVAVSVFCAVWRLAS